MNFEKQLLVLSAVVLSEPITSTVLLPFMVSMVRDFFKKQGDFDDRNIGFYAGILASTMAFAQFLSSIPIGLLSNKVGRRPLILLGLLGNIVTSIMFGMAQTYRVAVIARFLCGLFNGNIGVAKAILGEICTDKQQARGFALFGTNFAIGSIAGNVIGALLSNIALKYPSVFGNWEILVKYPYLLPCLVSSSVSAFGLLVGYWHLQETLGYRRLEAQPAPQVEIDLYASEELPLKPQNSIVQQSIRTILAYGTLAFVNIIFMEGYVLFTQTSTEHGGLGWHSTQVGFSMALSGVILFVSQTYLFPKMLDKYGLLTLFQRSMLFLGPAYFCVGLLHNVQKGFGEPLVWLCTFLLHCVRVLCETFGFTSVMVLVNNSSSRDNLSIVNGISQSFASLVRAFGPFLGGWAYSWSLKNGLSYPFNYHFVFVAISGISLLGWYMSLKLPQTLSRKQF